MVICTTRVRHQRNHHLLANRTSGTPKRVLPVHNSLDHLSLERPQCGLQGVNLSEDSHPRIQVRKMRLQLTSRVAVVNSASDLTMGQAKYGAAALSTCGVNAWNIECHIPHGSGQADLHPICPAPKASAMSTGCLVRQETEMSPRWCLAILANGNLGDFVIVNHAGKDACFYGCSQDHALRHTFLAARGSAVHCQKPLTAALGELITDVLLQTSAAVGVVACRVPPSSPTLTSSYVLLSSTEHTCKSLSAS
mmetsp:Transcript_60283/g.111806  ORF Transcript_60283/g.111806 Transcript_60283/m.111806 type:complete len:251 (-) Transcript_60283:68-820(-)